MKRIHLLRRKKLPLFADTYAVKQGGAGKKTLGGL